MRLWNVDMETNGGKTLDTQNNSITIDLSEVDLDNP